MAVDSNVGQGDAQSRRRRVAIDQINWRPPVWANFRGAQRPAG